MPLSDEEKEEILESLLEKITPDDVIAAIMSYMPDQFSSSAPRWHTGIKKLKEEYKDLLGEFGFVYRGRFPRSNLLEGTMRSLLQENLIHSCCGSSYCINENQREVLREIADKFSPEGKEKLKEIAQKLRENHLS